MIRRSLSSAPLCAFLAALPALARSQQARLPGRGPSPITAPTLPAAVQELATAEPARVDTVLAALMAQPPAAQERILGQARAIVAARVEAGAAGYRRLSDSGPIGGRLDVYDDLLRSLKLDGAFDGTILYPIVGADLLPARWAPMVGYNWTDHSAIFTKMARLAERPALAKAARHARVRTVPDMFASKTVDRLVRDLPPDGPRTLILKHADPYKPDAAIASAARGAYPGYDTGGLLRYGRWLDRMLGEALRKGDRVVVLSRDRQALRKLDSSPAFRRMATAARPRLPKGPQTVMHVDTQALYLPDEFRVYRKVKDTPPRTPARRGALRRAPAKSR